MSPREDTMATDEATLRLAEAIVRYLEAATGPVPRADLVALDDSGCKLSTRERRFRRARAWLVQAGHPLVSDGTGFRLAKTRAEFEAGIGRLEKTARSLWVEIAALRGMRPSEYLRQQALQFEEGDHAVS